MEFSVGDKVVARNSQEFGGVGTVTAVTFNTFNEKIVQVAYESPFGMPLEQFFFPNGLRLVRVEHHPSVQHLLDLFEYKHLPVHLQAVSFPCHVLAHDMAATLEDGIELSAALRHLLYAKDSFVRQAVIDHRKDDEDSEGPFGPPCVALSDHRYGPSKIHPDGRCEKCGAPRAKGV